jgi:hypothetical protein
MTHRPPTSTAGNAPDAINGRTRSAETSISRAASTTERTDITVQQSKEIGQVMVLRSSAGRRIALESRRPPLPRDSTAGLKRVLVVRKDLQDHSFGEDPLLGRISSEILPGEQHIEIRPWRSPRQRFDDAAMRSSWNGDDDRPNDRTVNSRKDDVDTGRSCKGPAGAHHGSSSG